MGMMTEFDKVLSENTIRLEIYLPEGPYNKWASMTRGHY